MNRYAGNSWRLAIILLAGCSIAGCTSRFDKYANEGRRLLRQQDYAAARGQFLAAHQLVPENADNLCNLAVCHEGMARNYMVRDDNLAAIRELDRAIAYYQRAIHAYPGYQKALEGMNRAQEMRGLYDEALKTAEWASDVVGPDVRRQLFLAREYAERGDADQALLAYQQAIAMDPANPSPHWALGVFYLKLGRRDEALASMERAYRLDPSQTFRAETIRRLGGEVPIVVQPD